MAHSTLRRNTYRRDRKNMSIDLGPGPRAASIQMILGYSRALKVVKAPPVGKIELILN